MSTALIRYSAVSAHQEIVLLAGVEAVKADARRFNMSYWMCKTVGDENHPWLKQAMRQQAYSRVYEFLAAHSHCGTTLCYAAFILKTAPIEFVKSLRWGEIDWAARRYAQLTDRQQGLLFCLGNWPARFLEMYMTAKSAMDTALALEARVHYFLNTGA
jgi:hypothetical protein